MEFLNGTPCAVAKSTIHYCEYYSNSINISINATKP